MLKTKVKLNFKLLSSNVLYDGVIYAEALNTCGLVALCGTAPGYESTLYPEPEVWHGEMPTLSRRGAPYWGRTRFCNTFTG